MHLANLVLFDLLVEKTNELLACCVFLTLLWYCKVLVKQIVKKGHMM
jgi:hypothetical protein